MPKRNLPSWEDARRWQMPINATGSIGAGTSATGTASVNGGKGFSLSPELLFGGLLGGLGLLGGGGGPNIPMPSTTPPYVSPYLSQMDTMLFNRLGSMINAFFGSGWGMPPELWQFMAPTNTSPFTGNTPGGFYGVNPIQPPRKKRR